MNKSRYRNIGYWNKLLDLKSVVEIWNKVIKFKSLDFVGIFYFLYINSGEFCIFICINFI